MTPHPTPTYDMNNEMNTHDRFADYPPVILASGSPRRKELLQGLSIPFTVQEPVDVDESAFQSDGLSPGEYANLLSEAKALSVARQVGPGSLVIGADTIVVIGEEILGKPKDEAHAKAMLAKLQNNAHEVYTSITVAHDRRTEFDFVKTRVWMKAMSLFTIEDYLRTGEPMGKAGAYAIQGYGSLLIPKIEGDYFNVVGLPLFLLNHLLDRFGYPLL